jgi:hypothetical protein
MSVPAAAAAVVVVTAVAEVAAAALAGAAVAEAAVGVVVQAAAIAAADWPEAASSNAAGEGTVPVGGNRAVFEVEERRRVCWSPERRAEKIATAAGWTRVRRWVAKRVVILERREGARGLRGGVGVGGDKSESEREGGGEKGK